MCVVLYTSFRFIASQIFLHFFLATISHDIRQQVREASVAQSEHCTNYKLHRTTVVSNLPINYLAISSTAWRAAVIHRHCWTVTMTLAYLNVHVSRWMWRYQAGALRSGEYTEYAYTVDHIKPLIQRKNQFWWGWNFELWIKHLNKRIWKVLRAPVTRNCEKYDFG